MFVTIDIFIFRWIIWKYQIHYLQLTYSAIMSKCLRRHRQEQNKFLFICLLIVIWVFYIWVWYCYCYDSFDDFYNMIYSVINTINYDFTPFRMNCIRYRVSQKSDATFLFYTIFIYLPTVRHSLLSSMCCSRFLCKKKKINFHLEERITRYFLHMYLSITEYFFTK